MGSCREVEGIFSVLSVIRCFILLSVVLLSMVARSESDNNHILTTVGPQKPIDISHDYFLSLLRKAVARFSSHAPVYEIRQKPHTSQERTLKLLKKGDVYDVICIS